MNWKTAAIIVTYNRKGLLGECLEAIINQTTHPDGIVIIDNASTDGTETFLKDSGYIYEIPPKEYSEIWYSESVYINNEKQKAVKIHYVRLPVNTGGAGGFYHGIKFAYSKGYDLFWLMDDDTIPTENALERLIDKYDTLSNKGVRVGFVCSKALWIDGTVTLMNVPVIITGIDDMPFNSFEENNVLIVKAASFVSILIPREVVKTVGLPIKEFFIWSDDVEYTLRITMNGFLGFYTKDSVIVHKSKSNYKPSTVNDWRYYYFIRNQLLVTRLHLKKIYPLHLGYLLLSTFKQPLNLWIPHLKACFSSMFFKFKIEKVDI
uniref:Glycosyltransferase n=1 Tax=Fervidobacterium pennivorans TaxID=93466 RepID=A0A7V4KF40_FERPE